jgi:hypothetical protein
MMPRSRSIGDMINVSLRRRDTCLGQRQEDIQNQDEVIKNQPRIAPDPPHLDIPECQGWNSQDRGDTFRQGVSEAVKDITGTDLPFRPSLETTNVLTTDVAMAVPSRMGSVYESSYDRKLANVFKKLVPTHIIVPGGVLDDSQDFRVATQWSHEGALEIVALARGRIHPICYFNPRRSIYVLHPVWFPMDHEDKVKAQAHGFDTVSLEIRASQLGLDDAAKAFRAYKGQAVHYPLCLRTVDDD